MRGRVNFRLLAGLVTTVLLLIGLLVVLQQWQIRRNAAELLELAHTAESQGNFDRAGRLISDYLTQNPSDTKARAWYGQMIEKQAGDSKAVLAVIEVYERVVAEDPNQDDCRKKLARLYVRYRMYTDAMPHLLKLKDRTPNDAELADLFGICYEAQINKNKEAGEWYRQAIERDPSSIQRYVRLAIFHQKFVKKAKADGATNEGNDNMAKADGVMNEMVIKLPNNAFAYLARARYLKSYKADDRDSDLLAVSDIRDALKLDPDNVEALLLAANYASADLSESRRHLQAALAKNPRDVRVYLALEEVGVRDRKPDEAVATLRQGLIQLPGNPALLLALADLAIKTRDTKEADLTLEELKRWQVDPAKVGMLLARKQMAAGDWPNALDTLQKNRPLLSTVDATLAAEADFFLGQCHEQLGDYDLALAAFQRSAAAVPKDPNDSIEIIVINSRSAIARTLIRLNRMNDAIEQYRKLAAWLEEAKLQKALREIQLKLASVRVSQYLSTPKASRNRADFELVFAEIEKMLPGAAEVRVLRAEVLADEGKQDEARRLLEDGFTQLRIEDYARLLPEGGLSRVALELNLLARRPDVMTMAIPLARLSARQEKTTEMIAVLESLSFSGDLKPLDDLIIRLQLLPAQEGRKAAAVAEQKLASSSPDEQLSLKEKLSLYGALAEAYGRWGEPKQVQKWWAEVVSLQPKNLDVLLQQFNLEYPKDRDRMIKTVKMIHDSEGRAGAGWPLRRCHVSTFQARELYSG